MSEADDDIFSRQSLAAVRGDRHVRPATVMRQEDKVIIFKKIRIATLMTILAGLQVVCVVAAIEAIRYVVRPGGLRLVLQRHGMRDMTFRAFREDSSFFRMNCRARR